MALTFMAKSNEREGNSCHIHLSAARRATARRCSPTTHGLSRSASTSSPGSSPTCASSPCSSPRTSTPTSGSPPGSFAPTAVTWGHGQPHLRAAAWSATGTSLRVENRVPGGDVNPYLACAALIAAGLHGIENELPLARPFTGNAYTSDADRACPDAARGAATCARAASSPARRSATRSSTTTPTTPTSSWPPSSAAVTDWERSGGSSDLMTAYINPATEEVVATMSTGARSRRPTPPSRAAAARRTRPGGTSRPATGPGCCGGFAEAVDAHLEELAQLEVRNAGHTIGNARWEAGQRPRRAALLRGRAGAAVRPADPGGRRGRRHVPRAARRGRRDRAVELPDADRRLGVRARARRRQHRGPQARRARRR